MAIISATPAQVRPILPATAEIVDGIAGTAITAGDLVHWDASGRLVRSNASAAATAKFAGVALNTVVANQAVSVLKHGYLAGYGVSSLAYGAKLYLSNSAGGVEDVPGTINVVVGAVVPMSDHSRTKVAYIEADYRSML